MHTLLYDFLFIILLLVNKSSLSFLIFPSILYYFFILKYGSPKTSSQNSHILNIINLMFCINNFMFETAIIFLILSKFSKVIRLLFLENIKYLDLIIVNDIMEMNSLSVSEWLQIIVLISDFKSLRIYTEMNYLWIFHS